MMVFYVETMEGTCRDDIMCELPDEPPVCKDTDNGRELMLSSCSAADGGIPEVIHMQQDVLIIVMDVIQHLGYL